MLASDIKMVTMPTKPAKSQQQILVVQQQTTNNINISLQNKNNSPKQKYANNGNKTQQQQQPQQPSQQQKAQNANNSNRNKKHHNYNSHSNSNSTHRRRYNHHNHQQQQNNHLNSNNMLNNTNENSGNNNVNNSNVIKNTNATEKLNCNKSNNSNNAKNSPQNNCVNNNSPAAHKTSTPKTASSTPTGAAAAQAQVNTTNNKAKHTPKTASIQSTKNCNNSTGNQNNSGHKSSPQQQISGAVVADKSNAQKDAHELQNKPKVHYSNKRKSYWKNSHSNNTNSEIVAKANSNSNCAKEGSGNNTNNIKNTKDEKQATPLQPTNTPQQKTLDKSTVDIIASAIDNKSPPILTVPTTSIQDTKNNCTATSPPTELEQAKAKEQKNDSIISALPACILSVKSTNSTKIADTSSSSTCILDSNTNSSNTYSLDFLHSVGVEVTGTDHKNNTEALRAAIKYVIEPPIRSALNSNTTTSNAYRPNRFIHNGGGIETPYHQYPYYHHQPSQLTIASFLQKDMLSESILENNSNRKNFVNQQSYSQHRYQQNFMQANYQSHQPYAMHKNGYQKSHSQYACDYKIDNCVIRYHQHKFNSNMQSNYQQYNKRSNSNSGSISSASSTSSNSSKVSATYRRQHHYKYRTHTSSAIETVSSKHHRVQHRNHYYNNHQGHYVGHYSNYQQHSGGTTPTAITQHQNFNNLTYVSTNGKSYMQNVVSSLSKSRTRSPINAVNNICANLESTLLSKSHNSRTAAQFPLNNIISCAQLDAATTNAAATASTSAVRPTVQNDRSRLIGTPNSDCDSNDSVSMSYQIHSPTCSSSSSTSLNSLNCQELSHRTTQSVKVSTRARSNIENKLALLHSQQHVYQHMERRQHVASVPHQYYNNTVMPVNFHGGYYDETYAAPHFLFNSNEHHNGNASNRCWSPTHAKMMYPPAASNVLPTTATTAPSTPSHSPRLPEHENQLHSGSSTSSISASTSDTLTLEYLKMSSSSPTKMFNQAQSEQPQQECVYSQSQLRKNSRMCASDMHLSTSVSPQPAQSQSIKSLIDIDSEPMFTPSDRYMARAHLIEVKDEPPNLLNNSKWDKLSQQVWDKFVSSQQTQETFKQKMRLWRFLYILIKLKMKHAYPRYGLYLVGSTISGFGADSSDVDMCLVARGPQTIDLRTDALINLTLLRNCLMEEDEFESFHLIEAKVPILRFKQKKNHYEVDLNFNNSVGIKNTHLLYCYSQLDWRVRPMVLVSKLWAQYHNINNAKNMTISSYSLVLMVIHYLQYGTSPCVLPCLHEMYPEKFTLLRYNDFGYVDMNENIGCSFQSKNTQSLGELYLGFLEYYSKFDYGQFAISVRTGGVLPIETCRQAKSLKNDVHQWKVLCIEEPFDLTNTARSVYDFETFAHIKAVFKQSWKILRDAIDLNSVFSPLFLPTGALSSSLYSTYTPTLTTTALVALEGQLDIENIAIENEAQNEDDTLTESTETSLETKSSVTITPEEIIEDIIDSSPDTADITTIAQEDSAEMMKDINYNSSIIDSSCSVAVNTPQNAHNSNCKSESSYTAVIF